MRRIAIGAALTVVGVLVARALAPKLRTGCLTDMFERMPDDFPPKRVMGGIEEIRANTELTRELLEQREQGEVEPSPRD